MKTTDRTAEKKAVLKEIKTQIQDTFGSIQSLRNHLAKSAHALTSDPNATLYGQDDYELYAAHVQARIDYEIAKRGDSYGRHHSTAAAASDRLRDLKKVVTDPAKRFIQTLPEYARPQLIVVIGPAGIGKSKLIESGRLAHDTKLPVAHAFHLDHDRIKKQMRRAGLGLEVKDLTPEETAPLLHRESMVCARSIARNAIESRRNLIVDFGTPVLPEEVERIAKFANSQGYAVHVVELDADIQQSHDRAARRHVMKMQPGENRSGRFVTRGNINTHQAQSVSRGDGTSATTDLAVMAMRLREIASSVWRYQRTDDLRMVKSERRSGTDFVRRPVAMKPASRVASVIPMPAKPQAGQVDLVVDGFDLAI